MSISKFTQEDVQKLRAFGALLIQKAKFTDLTIPETVALNRSLQHYNEIVTKIEAHILEIIKVTEPEDSTDKKSNKKAK